MSLFVRFPYLQDILDVDAAVVEQRFRAACQTAGVDPDSQEAEPIAINLLADAASNQLVVRMAP